MISVSIDTRQLTMQPATPPEPADTPFSKEQYITDLASEWGGKALAHAGDAGEEDHLLTFGFPWESDARDFRQALSSTFRPTPEAA